jgi:hypothetical protein
VVPTAAPPRGFRAGLIRRAALVSVLFLALAPTIGVADSRATEPSIELGEVRLDGPRLSVSFQVSSALTGETLERLQAGLTLTYRHRVQVTTRRWMPLWPARTLASLVIDTTARYDSLIRQFELTRAIRVRGLEQQPALHEQSAHTESTDEMTRWMTQFHDLPELVLAQRVRGPMRLRIESVLERRYAWLVIPTRVTASAQWPLDP